jgi:hypothetical protein
MIAQIGDRPAEIHVIEETELNALHLAANSSSIQSTIDRSRFISTFHRRNGETAKRRV